MATATQPALDAPRVVEVSSSSDSETSQASQEDPGARDPRVRPPPRPTRSPVRPLLRTAFRSFSGVATVIVGETSSKSRPQTQFLVHKELLTAASPFFAAALNGTFAEGLDQTVRLPEEKPETFEWFLQWLYTGSLTVQPTSAEISRPNIAAIATASHIGHANINCPLLPCSTTPRSSDLDAYLDGDLRNIHGSPKYFVLLDLYALSDRLLTTPLSNHVLSTIARLSETTNSVPTPSDTWILYDSIHSPSPLQALILDLFTYKKTDKLLETHKDIWHPQFLRDLVVKLKRPGPEAIDRHSLVAWRPRSWSTSKACEGCKVVLKPGFSGDKCCNCDKAFCGDCLRRHGGESVPGWNGDLAGCKPWMGKGLCLRYHQHGEGEACA